MISGYRYSEYRALAKVLNNPTRKQILPMRLSAMTGVEVSRCGMYLKMFPEWRKSKSSKVVKDRWGEKKRVRFWLYVKSGKCSGVPV